MKVLAIGDIVGEAGVKKLKEELPKIKKQEGIDFVITNGENAAGGMGLTERYFKDIVDETLKITNLDIRTLSHKIFLFNFLNYSIKCTNCIFNMLIILFKVQIRVTIFF